MNLSTISRSQGHDTGQLWNYNKWICPFFHRFYFQIQIVPNWHCLFVCLCVCVCVSEWNFIRLPFLFTNGMRNDFDFAITIYQRSQNSTSIHTYSTSILLWNTNTHMIWRAFMCKSTTQVNLSSDLHTGTHLEPHAADFITVLTEQVQIATFMGPQGAHLGPIGPRWAPCWPREPCYQGWLVISIITWMTLAISRRRKWIFVWLIVCIQQRSAK